MVKGLKQRDLLYVSNADGTVSVYRYWQRTLVGVLTNFTQPMGECADAAGDVYITDYAASTISEYAHGGTKPIRVLEGLEVWTLRLLRQLREWRPGGCQFRHIPRQA